MNVDIHQHFWPDALVEELRRRSRPPRLDGWTLLTAGEPPFEVNPADHDAGRRARQAACDGTGLAVVGLSSPLGIEYLMPGDAEPLLDAYHCGVAALGTPFAGCAAAGLTAIDAPGLAKQLDRGFVGLQLPATAVADEADYRWCSPLLDMLAERFAFRAYGRPAYPGLRVCFAALAGLGPLHGERLAARGGADPLARGAVDPRAYVETSSYGSRGIDSILRVLGVDMVVYGSDRPYAQPRPDRGLGEAARHAIGVANPARLLHG